MAILIYPVTTIDECRQIEQLQIKIWQSTDLEAAPDHLLWTIAKEGGQVLLAVSDSGEPIGFAYGFLAQTASGRLKLASHQVGVLPAYQDQGVGYQLKLAQRKHALADQLDLITWTYDPLLARNARLNLGKLGAVCNTYLANLYGEMRDELNQGLPSDRFRVDWWLTSPWVTRRLREAPRLRPIGDIPILNPAQQAISGLLTPPDEVKPPQGEYCLIEIPADFNRLRKVAPELAGQWRLQTRQLFEQLFLLGYTAVDLLGQRDQTYYLLQKNWQI
jgi:predicted GNAT superfamily acetyltransferase